MSGAARFFVDTDGIVGDAATARGHFFAGGGPLGPFVEAAETSIWRTDGTRFVHAHRHGADCNERCTLVFKA